MANDISILCSANTAISLPVFSTGCKEKQRGYTTDGDETNHFLAYCKHLQMEITLRQNIQAECLDK